MGESALKEGGPGSSGFAGNFVESLRRSQGKGRPGWRFVVTTAGLAVVVCAASAFGTGVLLAGHHSSSGKPAADASGVTPVPVVGGGSLSASPSATASGTLRGTPGGPSQTSNTAGAEPRASAAATARSAGSGTNANSAKSGTSTSTPTAAPTHEIVSGASGRCIDVNVTQYGDNPGIRLQIWDCNKVAWQEWTFAADGTLRSEGLCMNVAGGSTADGAAVEADACNGSSSEKFTLNTSYDLVNTPTGKCVDVKDRLTANGTPLQLWTCGGTSNQKWTLL